MCKIATYLSALHYWLDTLYPLHYYELLLSALILFCMYLGKILCILLDPDIYTRIHKMYTNSFASNNCTATSMSTAVSTSHHHPIIVFSTCADWKLGITR